MRLRVAIPDAKIWARDKKGVWIEGTMTLPEGWYALPDPGPEEVK